jgi:hypothetical protein
MLVIFVSAFFVLSPIMIIYAMGFRFDWSTHKLIGRGGLSVDINPKIGDVYLNNIKLEKNRFNKKVEIKNIIPDKYKLIIKTPNYYDWSKEIEITGNKTIYVKQINLIKKDSPKILIDKKIDNFSISENKNYIAYIINENDKKTLRLLNIEKNKDEKIFALDNQKYKIEWMKEKECAVVYLEKEIKEPKIFCINEEGIKNSLIKSESEKIQKLQWINKGDNPEIFYSTSKKLYSFKPLINQKQEISTNNYIDWFFENNSLWTLQINTSSKKIEVIKNTLGFKTKFKELKLPIISTSTGKQQPYSIVYANNNNILIKNGQTNTMLLINENKDFELSGQNFVLSSHNDWWIIWSSFEMWTYVENTEPELQIRSGENLKQVAPLDEYNALSLIWEKNTTYLYPYYLVRGNLFDLSMNHIGTDPKNRIMYFTRKDKVGIWKINY